MVRERSAASDLHETRLGRRLADRGFRERSSEMVSRRMSGAPRRLRNRVSLAGGDSRFGYNVALDDGPAGSASVNSTGSAERVSWNPITREVLTGHAASATTRSNLETHSLAIGYEGPWGWKTDFRWGFDGRTHTPMLSDAMSNYTVRSRDTNRSSGAFNLTKRLELSSDVNSTVVLGWDRISLTGHNPTPIGGTTNARRMTTPTNSAVTAISARCSWDSRMRSTSRGG